MYIHLSLCVDVCTSTDFLKCDFYFPHQNKNLHLEISEEQLETSRKEIQDLQQQVESLKVS